MELPRQYPYNPKWRVLLACAALFGACSTFMAYQAVHNGVGLIIDGIIRLGPAGATVFYWVISVLGAGFVLIALLSSIRGLVSPKVIELDKTALLLPWGRFQRDTARIDYSAIQAISETQISGQRILYIHSGGRKYSIVASLLPDLESYLAIRDFLISRAPR